MLGGIHTKISLMSPGKLRYYARLLLVSQEILALQDVFPRKQVA